MERLQFMGSTLFIPIFLVSVGVLLEPKVLIDPKTLGIALVFTLAVLGGKALAAVDRGADLQVHVARGRRDVGPVGLAGGGHAGDHAGGRQAGPLRHADDQRRAGRDPRVAGRDAGDGELLRQAGQRGRPTRSPRWGRPCWFRCGASRRARRSPSRAGWRPATAGSSLAASFADKAAPPPEVATQRGAHRQGRGVAGQGRARVPDRCFGSRRRFPEGLLETVLGEDATLLVTEWRTLAPERGRQRGVRGSGARAGAGADRARRRRAFRSAGARR